MGVFHLLMDYRGELQQEHTLASGREKKSQSPGPCLSPPLLLNPLRRINRRALYFVPPLTGPAYVQQRLQRVERSRVEGHVSGADCVWAEDFFDIEFGLFSLPSPCG